MKNIRPASWFLAIGLAMAIAGSAFAALKDIYPAPEMAPSDLVSALQTATSQHRRIIVDFGGNWCPDCHVLDGYFHDAANKPILDAHFLLVHVNIGNVDRNVDIAERYQIPLRKGVPALAVLDSDGQLLYSQKAGEFEAMRRMESSAVTRFLLQWMPSGAA